MISVGRFRCSVTAGSNSGEGGREPPDDGPSPCKRWRGDTLTGYCRQTSRLCGAKVPWCCQQSDRGPCLLQEQLRPGLPMRVARKPSRARTAHTAWGKRGSPAGGTDFSLYICALISVARVYQRRAGAGGRVARSSSAGLRRTLVFVGFMVILCGAIRIFPPRRMVPLSSRARSAPSASANATLMLRRSKPDPLSRHSFFQRQNPGNNRMPTG